MSSYLFFVFAKVIMLRMDYKFENVKLIDFIKTISAYKGFSLRKLLARLNENSDYSPCYPSFYNKLKNNTLKFKEISDIANILGYEIIFRDIKK